MDIGAPTNKIISVCAIEHTINEADDKDIITGVIPIAGDLKDGGGGNLDAQWTRLSTSPSHADSEKEGLRVELNGGVYNKRKQTAIVELICDKERTGLEGEIEPEDQYESRGEDQAEESPNAASLTFLKYGPASDDSDSDVLRLEWRTKHACEGPRDDEGGSTSSHWGFFTWFIIVYVFVNYHVDSYH